MSNEIVQVAIAPDHLTMSEQAQTDQQLISLWLHGRSPQTQRAYRADAEHLLAYSSKSLSEIALADLQEYADFLALHLAPASRHRRLSAVKSLLSFACRIGYLRFDIGRPLRLPVLRDRLAERILSETEVQKMLAHERHPRNHALLYVLYASGVRVSECCSLCWRDVQERAEGSGQITVLGKGGKTNTILLPASVWRLLVNLRGDAGADTPVFRSRKGKHLHPTQVRRIVKRAAKRAGIEKSVSPHWYRHAHASHALDRGAPIHLVQATLAHASVATTGKYLHARPADSSARYLGI